MTGTRKSDSGYYSFERGGLTGDPGAEAEPVARFAYCANCEREVPVDKSDHCMHCYQPIPPNSAD